MSRANFQCIGIHFKPKEIIILTRNESLEIQLYIYMDDGRRAN